MKIFWEKKSGNIVFQVEDEDIQEIGQIAEMMKLPAWKKLEEWTRVGREAIIEAGKQGTKTRASADLSGLKFSKLDGYDCCSGIADTVVASAVEMFKKTNEAIMEAQNAVSEQE